MKWKNKICWKCNTLHAGMRECPLCHLPLYDFCSSPGCGYPDGKPCIGCGRVVPAGTPHFIDRVKERQPA